MKVSQISKMTEREQKLLEYYKQYRKQHNTHPRLKDVARHFKISAQAISKRAYNLVELGYFTTPYAGAFIHTRKK